MRRSLARAISGRFDSRGLRWYARVKLAADPVYEAALEELRHSPHPLLDIGCGIGLLGFYLRERGVGNAVLGIDTDREKVEAGSLVAAAGYEGVELRCADARSVRGFSGDVALIDVLHYLTDAEQRDLLATAATCVAPGGVVIIRDCIRDGSWRYRMTWMEESFARTVGWLRVPRLNFPTVDTLMAGFKEGGFDCSMRPLWGRTPYNNYLIIARRPQRS